MNYQITLKPQALKIIPQILTHSKKDKFYAFDMDGTLIQTKGRSRFAINADDWQWFRPRKALENQHNNMFFLILSILKKNPHAKVIIFSNQGGIRPMTFGVNASYSSTKAQNITHDQHLDKKLLTFLDKILNILKSFYEELGEERVYFYCSMKTPLPKNEKERKLYSSYSGKKLNNAFDRILKKKESVSQPNEEGSIYIHDIQDCTVKYRNYKIFIRQFDSLDENKLFNVLKFDSYRKPNTGMLQEFYYDIETQTDIECYVGDAAGRKNDFSDSDRLFAIKGNLIFHTPEELFSMYPIV